MKKKIFTTALALSGAAFAVPSPYDGSSSTQPEGVANNYRPSFGNPAYPHSFASTDGVRFRIDGKTGSYLVGTNCYWCSFLTAEEDLRNAFFNMASSGVKIVRIWGFYDRAGAKPGPNEVYFQHLSAQGSTINTGRYGLQLLDNAVRQAERNKLKLIINFVNNWDDFGGIRAYTEAFGGDHNSWYTNMAAQTQYRTYIETVVRRYRRSNAVFAWELANEPRCKGCDTNVIYQWAKDISAFIKSLDPYHMVTLGDEGFGLPGDGSYPYTYTEGVDFVKNLGIRDLDFGVLHLYPEDWGQPVSFGSEWIDAHAKVCKEAGKPCFLEEYGVRSDHCAKERPWQITAVNAYAIAADALWQWGDKVQGGLSDNDGHTIYHGSSEWQCLVKDHVDSLWW